MILLLVLLTMKGKIITNCSVSDWLEEVGVVN